VHAHEFPRSGGSAIRREPTFPASLSVQNDVARLCGIPGPGNPFVQWDRTDVEFDLVNDVITDQAPEFAWIEQGKGTVNYTAQCFGKPCRFESECNPNGSEYCARAGAEVFKQTGEACSVCQTSDCDCVLGECLPLVIP